MKKLVIKTITITLASLIGALALAFGALVLFAPGYLGGVFDGAGNYSASVFFYEKQYERTGDINDLNTLVLKLDIDSDGERAEKYYSEIINHADFNGFCENNTTDGNAISEKEYYYGNYALCLAKNGKFDNALDFATQSVSEEYTAFSPMRVLIYDFLTVEMRIELILTETALNGLTPVNGAGFLDIDKDYIASLING